MKILIGIIFLLNSFNILAKGCPELTNTFKGCKVFPEPGVVNSSLELIAMNTALKYYTINIEKTGIKYKVDSTLKIPFTPSKDIEDSLLVVGENQTIFIANKDEHRPDSELDTYVFCKDGLLVEEMEWVNLSSENYGEKYYQDTKTWKYITTSWEHNSRGDLIRRAWMGEKKDSKTYQGRLVCTKR